MSTPPTLPFVRSRDDVSVHRFELMQLEVRVLVGTGESGGMQSVTEFAFSAPFEGPPLHWHRGYAETFVCLEGQFTLIVDGVERTMHPGDIAHVPAATVHTYRVDQASPTRYLLVCTPGSDFEQYVADAAALAAESHRHGQRADERLMRDIRGRHQTYEADVPRF